MEAPRFAQHLPEGEFLDWSFRQEVRNGRKTRFRSIPSLPVIEATWDHLPEFAAVHIAAHAEDPAAIDFVVARSGDDEGIRIALLRNPRTPLRLLVDLLDRTPRPTNLETLLRERRPEELGALIVLGFDPGGHTRNKVTWLTAYVTTNPEETAVEDAFSALHDSYHPLLVDELARTATDARFPLRGLLDRVLDDPHTTTESLWRHIGAHLAERGTAMEIRQAVNGTSSTALRLPLLANGRLELGTALHRLPLNLRIELLERHSEKHPLNVDQTRLVSTLRLPGEALHTMHYDDAAVDWALGSGDLCLAGAVVWKSSSDAELVRVLRRNDESHQWARHHLWRVGRIWHRLTQGTRRNITRHFDQQALTGLNVATIRQWLIAHGEPGQVAALTLPRPEVRALVERVEASDDPELAWIAAHLVERPRDRVRMAEIGLRAVDREQQLNRWVRSATSNEIVRLWNVAGSGARDDLSTALVRGIRTSDDTHWLDKLVGGLRTDWQAAPVPVQEAAAAHLAAHALDEETWTAVWALYPEWGGTLDELLDAARTL